MAGRWRRTLPTTRAPDQPKITTVFAKKKRQRAEDNDSETTAPRGPKPKNEKIDVDADDDVILDLKKGCQIDLNGESPEKEKPGPDFDIPKSEGDKAVEPEFDPDATDDEMPAPAKASPFSFGDKPAAKPTPAPKPAPPFSFGGFDGSKPAAKPKPEPEPAPKPVFSIFGVAKPPPKQGFEAPPYKPFTLSQREDITAEYKTNTRLDAQRKKTLAKTHEVTEKQLVNYWEKIRGADSSYVKTTYRTKPEVAPGLPPLGDLPVEKLKALKKAYDEDPSLSAERQKTLAQENKIKPLQVQYYWEKLRDLDPNYERQKRVCDGNGLERKLAKKQAERDAKLSLKHQLGVAEPSTKARL